MGKSYRRGRSLQYSRRGKPKIPQVRIPIEKGKLSKFGYSTSKSDRARHTALNKAVDKYGALSVWRKLNAQVILRKSRQPQARAVFEEDADWVKENFKVDGFVS